MNFYRPTWAEIDLEAVALNLRRVKQIVGSRTKIMVTVKADAYGHGIIPVSGALVKQGVDYLGVASIDEGIVLRNAGINTPVLVLGTVLPRQAEPILEYNLTSTVCTKDVAANLNRAAAKMNKKALIHVKVDTGMGRLGVWHSKAAAFIRAIKGFNNLCIEGLFTHFPLADSDDNFTNGQILIFEGLVKQLSSKGIKFDLLHAANSMGLIGYKHSHFNMVRPGLMIYGMSPKQNLQAGIKPVLSLKTRIVFINRFPKGSGISYGHSYITKNKTTVVNLPIGYGDGYPRNLSNIAPVLIKGKRFKISGRICMDQTLVDVGGLKVGIGDEVVLIGVHGKQNITVEELAHLAGTIPYEIVCGIGARVPRVYSGQVSNKI